MKDFVGFLFNVCAHWLTLITGIIGLIFSQIERARKKPLAAKWSFAFALFATFYACFQAREDEHRNSELLTSQKASLTGENNTCNFESKLKELRISDLEHLDIANENFLKQNRLTSDVQEERLGQQQSQIGECLINEAKLNPAVSTEYHVLALPLSDLRDESSSNGSTPDSFSGYHHHLPTLLL